MQQYTSLLSTLSQSIILSTKPLFESSILQMKAMMLPDYEDLKSTVEECSMVLRHSSFILLRHLIQLGHLCRYCGPQIEMFINRTEMLHHARILQTITVQNCMYCRVFAGSHVGYSSTGRSKNLPPINGFYDIVRSFE